MRRPTIYEVLRDRLGREPTNAELRADVERIKSEAYVETAARGGLPHQRRRLRSRTRLGRALIRAASSMPTAEEERAVREGRFSEVTVGGAQHRRATPRVTGAANVHAMKLALGVCLEPGCMKVAGHEGDHT
jgi:hypothetical protein